jgi:SAM-dependent methyltransferase
MTSPIKERARAFVKHPTTNRLASAVRFDLDFWQRYGAYDQCDAWINELHPATLDAVEISGAEHWKTFAFKTYTDKHYPHFDICRDELEPASVDLVIADQVFEHLPRPYRAAKNIYAALRPGGHFLILVPFLIRIHREPLDCTRWSEDGLKYFLEEAGFALADVRTGSWGNRACVIANLTGLFWAPRGWGSIRNESDFPVNVWALARKTPTANHRLDR